MLNQAAQAPIRQVPPATPASEKSNNKKYFYIIAAILLLFLIATSSFFLGALTNKDPYSKKTLSSDTETAIPTISELITPSVLDKTSPTPTTETSPTPSIILKSKILLSDAELDGFRSSNGSGVTGKEIRAGRNINLVTRGFVSFDLEGLPNSSKIDAATLRLYQTKTEGEPYRFGGNLKIDHLTYGDDLDKGDYAAPALLSSFTTLTNNNSVDWKSADVTDQIKDDLANARSQSQFRIHFDKEVKGGEADGDFAYFESADNSEGTGNIPQLVVKYH
jgi:hypothetical protein